MSAPDNAQLDPAYVGPADADLPDETLDGTPWTATKRLAWKDGHTHGHAAGYAQGHDHGHRQGVSAGLADAQRFDNFRGIALHDGPWKVTLRDDTDEHSFPQMSATQARVQAARLAHYAGLLTRWADAADLDHAARSVIAAAQTLDTAGLESAVVLPHLLATTTPTKDARR